MNRGSSGRFLRLRNSAYRVGVGVASEAKRHCPIGNRHNTNEYIFRFDCPCVPCECAQCTHSSSKLHRIIGCANFRRKQSKTTINTNCETTWPQAIARQWKIALFSDPNKILFISFAISLGFSSAPFRCQNVQHAVVVFLAASKWLSVCTDVFCGQWELTPKNKLRNKFKNNSIAPAHPFRLTRLQVSTTTHSSASSRVFVSFRFIFYWCGERNLCLMILL